MTTIYTQRADVHIRWMIRRDMPEVQAIENASFDSPWSEEEFIRSLRNRNFIGMVAETGEKIVGYMIYELHRNRLEILNLAVHGEHKLSPQRRTRIDAAVCERNEIAHYWLKACGFTAVVILRDHYEEIAADAYLFRLTYGEAAGDPANYPRPKCRRTNSTRSRLACSKRSAGVIPITERGGLRLNSGRRPRTCRKGASLRR